MAMIAGGLHDKLLCWFVAATFMAIAAMFMNKDKMPYAFTCMMMGAFFFTCGLTWVQNYLEHSLTATINTRLNDFEGTLDRQRDELLVLSRTNAAQLATNARIQLTLQRYAETNRILTDTLAVQASQNAKVQSELESYAETNKLLTEKLADQASQNAKVQLKLESYAETNKLLTEKLADQASDNTKIQSKLEFYAQTNNTLLARLNAQAKTNEQIQLELKAQQSDLGALFFSQTEYETIHSDDTNKVAVFPHGSSSLVVIKLNKAPIQGTVHGIFSGPAWPGQEPLLPVRSYLGNIIAVLFGRSTNSIKATQFDLEYMPNIKSPILFTNFRREEGHVILNNNKIGLFRNVPVFFHWAG